jgi:hypothetical protein
MAVDSFHSRKFSAYLLNASWLSNKHIAEYMLALLGLYMLITSVAFDDINVGGRIGLTA